MIGSKEISKRLQNMYFNLLGTLSSVLYSCRAAIAQRSSILRSVAQFVVSMWREEHSTLMRMYTESVRTLKSSIISVRIWSLISLFGSLALKIILIGFTCLTFMMALTVVVASKLVVMMRERLTTK